jgi:hypothetical protein
MHRPDFARTDIDRLEDRDLRFIIENFPVPGRSYEEISQLVNSLPTTLESILSSDYLYEKVCDRSRMLLDISPFLLFSVLLRRSLDDHRTRAERKIINYMANLLSLFIKTDRLYRVQPGDPVVREYIVDLVEEAQHADTRRKFYVYSHIGNFSLFLTGLFPRWIEYRHRYGRRPVDVQYYTDFGRSCFQRAAEHPIARELELDEVFLRLALLFDSYMAALNRMSRDYLHGLN